MSPFYECNAITRENLPQGRVPGAPRSGGNTFFWPLPIFGRTMLRISQKSRGPVQCKAGPGNNMVNRRNQ